MVKHDKDRMLMIKALGQLVEVYSKGQLSTFLAQDSSGKGQKAVAAAIAPVHAHRPSVTARRVYKAVARAPKRKAQALHSTPARVYAYLTKRKAATAPELFAKLSLRPGQLWGSLRRLQVAGLIRTEDMHAG